MSLFPDTMPAPEPNMVDEAYWAYLRDRKLKFQRCAVCETLRHPPAPVCPSCRNSVCTWVEAPTEAHIYSYTIVHHPSHPAVRECLPYVVGLIEFPGLPTVRLVSNIWKAPPETIHVGMAVALEWEETLSGPLPRFRPADARVAV